MELEIWGAPVNLDALPGDRAIIWPLSLLVHRAASHRASFNNNIDNDDNNNKLEWPTARAQAQLSVRPLARCQARDSSWRRIMSSASDPSQLPGDGGHPPDLESGGERTERAKSRGAKNSRPRTSPI